MNILSVDPGNIESAYCIIEVETLKPLEFGKISNKDLYRKIILNNFNVNYENVAIEMIKSYGMGVGQTVFDTCIWIGIFKELIENKWDYQKEVDYINRMEEKMHICHDSRAKDTNIRHALIDRFAQHDKKQGKGTKKKPDWFFGFRADMWAAYAVGITYVETKL